MTAETLVKEYYTIISPNGVYEWAKKGPSDGYPKAIACSIKHVEGQIEAVSNLHKFIEQHSQDSGDTVAHEELLSELNELLTQLKQMK